MRDDFLFDDDDPKQRGRGRDALEEHNPRLKFNWKWLNDRPSQISFAEIGGFRPEAIFWHTEYEAQLGWYSDSILNERGYKTRLDAQVGAERLLRDLRDIVTAALKNDDSGARAEAAYINDNGRVRTR